MPVPDAAATPSQLAIWGEEAAARYDTPGEGVFADAVLGPTVDRLVELADGGAVLELAIGTGRVAVPLRERGVPVSGIELSPAMVEVLRTKADAERIPVVVGDMATERAPGDFSLVVLVYNTISNLQTQDQQVACFANAARHLGPGGRFVVELWVPDVQRLAGQPGVVTLDEPGHLLVDSYDVLHQRAVSHHVTYDGRGAARVELSPHRYVWPAELDLMARLAGFSLEHRWADWERSPFTAQSRSHVSVYRLRRDP